MKVSTFKLTSILSLVVLLILTVGCKKDSTTSSNVQARATNSFGQTLPQSSSCRIKKGYETSPDTATYFSYDASGLLTSVVGKEGASETGRIVFYYDGTNRLTKVNNGETEFIIFYGSTDSRAEKIIITEIGSTRHDTVFCSYPDASKIVSTATNYVTRKVDKDTLEFDADNNLVKATTVFGPVGGTLALQSRQVNTFNTGIKSFYYPNAMIDYSIIVELTEPAGTDLWPAGKHLVAETYVYDYTISTAAISHTTPVEQRTNANNYPTYAKYKNSYSSGVIGYSIFNFEYDCN